MQHYGITVPVDGIPLAGQRDLIAELADLGYTDAWSSERAAPTPSRRWSSPRGPRAAAGPGHRARLHPWPGAAGQSAAGWPSAPGRVVLGIGASSDVIVERWNGIPFDEPLQRVRDTGSCGSAGGREGDRATRPSLSGFRLGLVPEPPPPSLVAALRPGMLRLAGREGDGAILNWLSPATWHRRPVRAEVGTERS